jgi:hypothetical protein
MAVAMIYPEPEKGGRGKTVSLGNTFDKVTLSKARTVLAVLPKDAEQVRDGGV